MPPPNTPDPASFLPLSAANFVILLALSRGATHGYGMMKFAATPEGGALRLGAGTLYGSLDRLQSAGLVEDTGTTDNERRRYYRLTTLGAQVFSAELARLHAALASARPFEATPTPAEGTV